MSTRLSHPTPIQPETHREYHKKTRLSKDPKMLQTYAKIIEEQDRRGFIEKVPDVGIPDSQRVHYIPHHPLNDITSLLVRFRLKKFAVTTDIEKAFLNIELHEKDRDVTRYLWLSNPKNSKSQLITFRFKAVLFGATCCPFILSATISKHLELNTDVKAAGMLSCDLYVDNVLSSFNTETELLTYYQEARELMKRAGTWYEPQILGIKQ
ncbi:uncharacterized protein LOC128559686 [Mercenaria mercenaria]|uniref:uncharacterized protein LOC128559686 n=1 Tax=Mercenaria mercenaria TaxID=6596 RepID=UPI00234E7463|nr:uncharacterized protein LOC128559686 [Mercenaria mercenaria]